MVSERKTRDILDDAWDWSSHWMPHETRDLLDALVARIQVTEARAQRVEEAIRALAIDAENMQDALIKVEWVCQGTNPRRFACAFCGGVSIRDGGHDHADDCEWTRLNLLDTDADRRLAALTHGQEGR